MIQVGVPGSIPYLNSTPHADFAFDQVPLEARDTRKPEARESGVAPAAALLDPAEIIDLAATCSASTDVHTSGSGETIKYAQLLVHAAAAAAPPSPAVAVPLFPAVVHAHVAPFRVVVVLARVRVLFLAPSPVALFLVAAVPATHVLFRARAHPRASVALWPLLQTVCRMVLAIGQMASSHGTYALDTEPSETDTTNGGVQVQAESGADQRTIQGDTFQIQPLELRFVVIEKWLQYNMLLYLPGDKPGIPGKLV